MKELIDIKFENDYKNKSKFKDVSCKYYRYNGNKTLRFLKERWSEQYGIDEDNQILFPLYSRSQRQFNVHNADSLQINHKMFKIFRQKMVPTAKVTELYYPKEYILFDKRNMMKIDEENKISQMTQTDIMNEDYQILILKYFDIKRQFLATIQFIMMHENVTYQTIFNYIENSFIPLNEKQHQFHQVIMKDMKEMRRISTNENMLDLYHMIQAGAPRKYLWVNVEKECMKQPISGLYR